MSHLYVAVLAVIVVVAAGGGLYRTSQVKTKADYLVAGRSLPAVVLVLTLLTSWIGAGSLFAGAENAYKNGFAALWQPAGGWLGLLLIYFIAPRAQIRAVHAARPARSPLQPDGARAGHHSPSSLPTSASPATSSRAAATCCT
jgi:Na+/proline symporter